MDYSSLAGLDRTECTNFLMRVINFARDASRENVKNLVTLSHMIPRGLVVDSDAEIQDLLSRLQVLQANGVYDKKILQSARGALAKLSAVSHS